MAIKSKVISFEEAANFVQDGNTVMICGCENLLVPDTAISYVEKRFLETGHPRGLTTFFPIIFGMAVDFGLEHFAHEGMTETVISSSFSYLKTSRMTQLLKDNKINGYEMPMGTCFKIIQNIAANEPFTLSDVGMGTYVDPRVEGGKMNTRPCEDIVKIIEVEGKELMCYKHPKIDVCFLRGTTADENGNISLDEEPVKLGVMAMAMATRACGGKVVVQVKRLTQNGSIHPKKVEIPGIFVDAIVVDENQYTTGDNLNPALTGDIRMPLSSIPPLPLDIKKVILRRAAQEVTENHRVINLGVGMPVGIPNILMEEGRLEGKTFFPEHGSVGGVLSGRPYFGANINPEAIIDSTQVFNGFRGGALDISFLGCAQVDRFGNVDVSKFNGVVSGCGGFIDITYRTKTLVFCGTFMAGGLDIDVVDGQLKINQDGKFSKFMYDVEQITLSGKTSVSTGQRVLYVTERAVFKLEADGLHLIEIAKGVDLEKDIKAHIPFEFTISENLKFMDDYLFLP